MLSSHVPGATILELFRSTLCYSANTLGGVDVAFIEVTKSASLPLATLSAQSFGKAVTPLQSYSNLVSLMTIGTISWELWYRALI